MIQIFGTLKNFAVKTAQRWFAERRIPVQFVELKEKEIRSGKARSAKSFDLPVCQVSDNHKSGMSRGEFDSVVDAIAREKGSLADAIEEMIDKKSRDYASIAYLDDSEKVDKLFENQLKLMKQPVCRNGKNAATVGLAQKIWETWK